MTDVWFTSDTHFGHERILTVGRGRPFATIEEHDEAIIERWNANVKAGDRVYHNGDISFRGADATVKLFRRLKGQIFIQKGNHDRRAVLQAVADLRNVIDIDNYREIKVDGQHIMLMHYPISSWNKARYNSWMIHGHAHGNMPPDTNTRLDVGVDTNNFTPWGFEQIAEVMKGRQYIAVDHHAAMVDNHE